MRKEPRRSTTTVCGSHRAPRNLGSASAFLFLAALIAGSSAAYSEQSGYGYYRILDGDAIRYGVTDEERAIRENEPLLEGDRISVERGSRLEVVLPDFSRLRLDELTDVDFERLRVRDDRAETFRVRIFEGELQVSIDDEPEEFRLILDAADIYLVSAGSYRISAGIDYARVLVRDGFAEILTERGSAIARRGEEVIVDGIDDPDVWVQDAGTADALERWADANERSGSRGSSYADDRLGYVTSDLDEHGEWVDAGGSYAWRPLRGYGWERPYAAGYWYDTPYGIHWVPSYRWAWVTSHYGYWDFHASLGWLWYPSYSYSPARVHWYWGPSYVGWIPSGFYYRHYGLWDYHYFGYAGRGYGGYRGYDYWNFCPRNEFRHRRQRVYYDGVQITRRNGDALRGGIVTTDTRGLRRDAWRSYEDGVNVLLGNASRTRGGLTYRHPEDLPDAMGYVSRRVDARSLGADSGVVLGRPDRVPAGVRSDSGARRATVVPRGDGYVSDGAERGRPTAVFDSPRRDDTGSESRSRSSADRPSQSTAGRQRIVLPGAPRVQPGAESRPSQGDPSRVQPRDEARERPVPSRNATPSRSEPTRVTGRSESNPGWRIERRGIPERQRSRPQATPRRSSTPRSVGVPSRSVPSRVNPPRSTTRSSSSRPGSSVRSRGSSSAPTRSTGPSRRYDRPSGTRARGSSSTKSGSKSSGSSTSSGGSRGSSSSSGAPSSGASSSRSSSGGSRTRSGSGK